MAKSEHSFDNFIKEKLESYSSQDLPEWNFMQQKITAAENDLLFDEKIKDAVEDLKADSPEIQWEAFAAKRNRQVARRNKIITARLIESCLIIFLLWTLDNIGITDLIKPSNIKVSSSQPIANVNSSPVSGLSIASTEPQKSASGGNSTNSNLAQKKDEPKEKGFNRKKINAAFSLDENTIHKTLTKPPFINPFSSNPLTTDASGSNALKMNPSIPLLVSEEDCTSDVEHSSTYKIAVDNTYVSNENLVTPLDQQIRELPIDQTKSDLNKKVPPTIAVLKPVKSNKAVLLNVHSGLMMNAILTPPIKDNDPHDFYTQLKPGFQTAVSLGFQTKKFMVESGIIYQSITYGPNLTERVYITEVLPNNEASIVRGYYQLRFDKVHTQLLTLPVLIHINLMSRPSWSISTKAGLSISAALKNDFSVDTFATIYHAKSNQGIWGDITPEKNASSIISRINDNNNKGILDGGNFGINSYSNLVLGIRYQRQLKSNLSFYTELEFTRMLGEIGFGPNGDRFISGNLNTGISLKL